MSTLSHSLLGDGAKVSVLELTFPGLPTLDETYGVLMIGSFIGLISYGILIHQAYRYTRMYPKDRLVNRILVSAMLILDTFHNIVCMHAIYTYLVTDYFMPLALLRGIWSIQIQPLLAGFAVLICQSFFASRVYILDKKQRIVVAASLFLTFATMTCAIVGTVIAFRFQTYLEYRRYYWIDSAACACAIASDSLTATVLTIKLRRSRTGFRQTDTLLNRLILYTINNGLLTGVVNTLALIFALARPDTMIWIAIEIVAVRLYTNSVLAVLNSRKSLRQTADKSEPLEFDVELQSQPQSDRSGSDASQQNSRPGIFPSVPKPRLWGGDSTPSVHGKLPSMERPKLERLNPTVKTVV